MTPTPLLRRPSLQFSKHHHFRRWLAAFLGIALCWPAVAQATTDRPVFLVTEISVDEGVAVDRDAARDALAPRFGRLKDKLEVRSCGEVQSTMSRAALAQLVGGARGDDDLAGLQAYVDVDRVVFGRISKIGGVTEVQVRVFNVKEGVTEVGMSRRLKEGAAPQLVLTLLDSLADALVAWALDSYTDGTPSARFVELQNQKIQHAEPEAAPPAPLGAMAVAGGVAVGAGALLAVAGGMGLAGTSFPSPAAAPVELGVGIAAVVAGGVLIGVDAAFE